MYQFHVLRMAREEEDKTAAVLQAAINARDVDAINASLEAGLSKKLVPKCDQTFTNRTDLSKMAPYNDQYGAVFNRDFWYELRPRI